MNSLFEQMYAHERQFLAATTDEIADIYNTAKELASILVEADFAMTPTRIKAMAYLVASGSEQQGVGPVDVDPAYLQYVREGFEIIDRAGHSGG